MNNYTAVAALEH